MSDDTPRVDWDALYAEYRLGLVSIRELGRKYGISDTAIHKRAQANGWERDVGEAVRKRTQEKIFENEQQKRIADEVCNQLGANPEDGGNAENVADSLRPHKSVVEVAADIRAQIVGKHSEATESLRKTLKTLLGYIDVYLNKDGDDEERKVAHFILFPKQTDSLGGLLRTVSEMMERIQRLDRQSYAIDGDPRRIEVTGKDGNPIRVKKELDLSGFTNEELAALDKLAEAVSSGGRK